MKRAKIKEVLAFIKAREGQSDDTVTLALIKEFYFTKGSDYADVRDMVRTTRDLSG